MKVKRLRTLALKVFKTLNNMNPEYIRKCLIRQPSRRIGLLI